ncbi:hypothetical protein [Rhizobium alvei]|uniref:DUF2158 domain-containing protein n=1 Tax=Rhizobium alvei TaxID=1132659 RepID=A0ABT8YUF2_9HYPH|nr:hypothetical protein [Rhizobium alvei]MDO6966937.1 hypothetical protein [Rhizobium alvei]
MSKFKVGDRVRLKADGRLGVITAIDFGFYYAVRWDKGDNIGCYDCRWSDRDLELVDVTNTQIPRDTDTLTIRDQFAMAALTGLMSAHDDRGEWTTADAAVQAAQIVYEAADAMLEARKVKA